MSIPLTVPDDLQNNLWFWQQVESAVHSCQSPEPNIHTQMNQHSTTITAISLTK